jgi:tetratricopeptide (TPR) repeat protein
MNANTKESERPTLLLLSKARMHLEEGNFASSLASVQKAKKEEPHNIYILAFEKQLEQLIELTSANILTEEQRADIVDSIPGIIERATHGTHAPSEAPAHPHARITQAEPSPDRAAAMEWLKNQYFQHAHEYVRKGEYQHALAEIRRIFIIDPENQVAKNFERQIQELSELKSAQIPKLAERAKNEEAAHPAVIRVPSAGAAHEAHTVHAAKPHPAAEHAATEKKSPDEKPQRKRLSNVLVAVILIGVLFIGYGLFSIFTRPQAMKHPGDEKPGVITPRQEIYFQDPNAPPEQPYVITVTDSAKKADSATASKEGSQKNSRKKTQ